MSFVFVLLMQLALESPQEAFSRAEALYQEQRYDEAAGVYEKHAGSRHRRRGARLQSG